MKKDFSTWHAISKLQHLPVVLRMGKTFQEQRANVSLTSERDRCPTVVLADNKPLILIITTGTMTPTKYSADLVYTPRVYMPFCLA